MAVIHSLTVTVFILTVELSIFNWVILSAVMFIPTPLPPQKKVGFSYAVFQRYYNYFYRIWSHPICSHPNAAIQFFKLSAYFKALVTVKQTSYWNRSIFGEASKQWKSLSQTPSLPFFVKIYILTKNRLPHRPHAPWKTKVYCLDQIQNSEE